MFVWWRVLFIPRVLGVEQQRVSGGQKNGRDYERSRAGRVSWLVESLHCLGYCAWDRVCQCSRGGVENGMVR